MKPPPRLWVVWVDVFGPQGGRGMRAVIDTGANTSLIPPKILRAIGCDPAYSKEQVSILTAGGIQQGAVMRIPEVVALGHRIQDLEVMSHNLPQGGRIEGVLGMDFLIQIPTFQQLEKQFQKFFI